MRKYKGKKENLENPDFFLKFSWFFGVFSGRDLPTFSEPWHFLSRILTWEFPSFSCLFATFQVQIKKKYDERISWNLKKPKKKVIGFLRMFSRFSEFSQSTISNLGILLQRTLFVNVLKFKLELTLPNRHLKV